MADLSSPFDTPLSASARAFLGRVGELERQIRARLAETHSQARPRPADELRQQLADELEAQAAAVHSRGYDSDSPVCRQAWHLMARLADAELQGFEWWGREAFFERPLAADYPPPDGVPQELAAQLDQLLGGDQPDPELVRLYLLALGGGAFPELDSAGYRRRLLTVLRRTLPELTEPTGHLFPDAYRRHRQPGPVELLPPVGRWLVAALVVGALLLALSAPLWLRATATARHAVGEILDFRE